MRRELWSVVREKIESEVRFCGDVVDDTYDRQRRMR